VLRGTTPFLFATASGIQTFALGTTFWAIRSALLETGLAGQHGPSDLIKISTLAGGITGGVLGGLTRGRRTVLPATLMWSLFSCIGQVAHNRYKTPSNLKDSTPTSFWERLAKKSWSPMKFISDEEYADMLREKMLKLDVEVAILDDKITALKQQQMSGNDTIASDADSTSHP
jgi:hypothetical protein